MRRRYILSHASLRGIAALLVVFYHLEFGASVYLPWESATPFFKHGYLWVDLFFILSGFVISYTAGLGAHSWTETKAFWRARLARIYPLHLFCLAMLVAVAMGKTLFGVAIGRPDFNAWSGPSLGNLGLQLFLLNGLGGPVGWNIPTWSISTEAVAYLLFPLLALGKRWPLVIGALCFYAWIAATGGVLDIVEGIAVLRCLAGFSIGMAICQYREQLMRLPMIGLLQFLGLALALFPMLTGANDVIAIPGFVLIVVSTLADEGPLCRVLKWAPLVWLGEISYSIYLNHFWVLDGWHFVAERALPRLGFSPMAERAVIVSGGLLLVLVFSHVTWKMVEIPARRYLMRPRQASRRTSPEVLA